MNQKRNRGAFPGWRLGVCITLVVLAACNHEVQFAGSSLDKESPHVAIDQSFPAALLGDAAIKFKPMFGLVEERITLKEQASQTTTLHQMERAAVADPFTQGHDGALTTETFDVSSAGKLDMVLVVDDSSSMSSYQDLLKTGFQNLLSSISGSDWQLAVGTSTTVEPCLRSVNDGTNNSVLFPAQTPTIIKAADYAKDPAGTRAMFANLINAGVNTAYDPFGDALVYSGNERSLYGALRALDYTVQNNDATNPTKCKPTNWVRPDSAIAIFVVTDEDNCHVSSDTGYHHSSSNTPGYSSGDPIDGCNANEYNGTTLLNKLKAMNRTPGVDARVYGIYWRKNDAQNLCRVNTGSDRNAGSNQAWAFDTLVASTNGASGSICDASYDTTLTTMSQNVARIIKRQFTLKAPPVTQSAIVAVDGVETTDFTVTGSTLTLNNPTGSQKKLSVTYRHDAVPKFDHVTLTNKAAAGTLQVLVNNVALTSDKVTYDSTTGDLQFVDMPPDDAKIVVNYRKDQALPTVFDLSGIKMVDGPIQIMLGGQPATGALYDLTTHTLTFQDPPSDGAEIGITYRPVDYKITHYAAPAIDTTGLTKPVEARDEATGDPLTMSTAGGDYVFNEADIQDGRVVVLDYNYGDKGSTLSHPLANVPLDGTLEVKIDDGSPDCIGNVALVGQNLTFTCDADQIGEVSVAYKYIEQSFTTFTLDQDVPADGFVQVYIDGMTFPDFTRDGRTFTLPAAALTPTSAVRIIVTSQK